MAKNIFYLLFLFSNIIYSGDSSKVEHNKTGNEFISENGNAKLIVSPIGGRITSFTFDGYEFLIQKPEHELNYGSTLWPSPQSIWNWPPIKALDSDPYFVKEVNSNFIFTSRKDDLTGLVFTKSIYKSSGKNSFVQNFIITNEGQNGIAIAPWQITRVKKGGILFFPIGDGGQKQKIYPMAETQEINGIVWYKSIYGEKLESHLINTADGSEGWLAYAIDGKLFIKKYSDHSPAQFAPGEAEVIFYTSGDSNYIEIELQGAYENIPCKLHLNWNVEWIAEEIPKEIKVEIGNKDLLNFVRGIIK